MQYLVEFKFELPMAEVCEWCWTAERREEWLVTAEGDADQVDMTGVSIEHEHGGSAGGIDRAKCSIYM